MRGVFALLALPGAVPLAAQDFAPYDDDPKWAAMGEEIYRRYSCPMCHGFNARGGAGPDLTDQAWLRAPGDRMLFEAIKHGRPQTMMPPYADELPDEQIWLLVRYIAREERSRRLEAGGAPR